jgi:uncharacterized protein (DUF983 family)
LHRDEHPSQEDIDRFSDETGFCPHCGEEIWDDATQCHACDTWIETGTVHDNPTTLFFKKKCSILIIIIILIAFFWGVTNYF